MNPLCACFPVIDYSLQDIRGAENGMLIMHVRVKSAVYGNEAARQRPAHKK